MTSDRLERLLLRSARSAEFKVGRRCHFPKQVHFSRNLFRLFEFLCSHRKAGKSERSSRKGNVFRSQTLSALRFPVVWMLGNRLSPRRDPESSEKRTTKLLRLFCNRRAISFQSPEILALSRSRRIHTILRSFEPFFRDSEGQHEFGVPKESSIFAAIVFRNPKSQASPAVVRSEAPASGFRQSCSGKLSTHGRKHN